MASSVLGFTPLLVVGIFGIVFVGGFVKGVSGFGFAIAGTAVLATVIDPAQAVVVMLFPMLLTNLTLVTELDRADVRPCIRRFWPYVGAAVVGTLLGMALLGRIPARGLTFLLGVFTLGYVLVSQRWFGLPGEQRFVERCFTDGLGAKFELGLVSGLVFGASNVAVQVVAYLDHLELDRGTFVGVLSMILVGIVSVRVGVAWLLGLFGTDAALLVSALAIAPGLVGVYAGGRARRVIPSSYQTGGTLLLLTLIGLRLSLNGIGML